MQHLWVNTKVFTMTCQAPDELLTYPFRLQPLAFPETNQDAPAFAPASSSACNILPRCPHSSQLPLSASVSSPCSNAALTVPCKKGSTVPCPPHYCLSPFGFLILPLTFNKMCLLIYFVYCPIAISTLSEKFLSAWFTPGVSLAPRTDHGM